MVVGVVTAEPVEVTTRYATRVRSLTEAWAFVMDRVDAVGPDPRIEITPTWIYGNESIPDGERWFSIVVDGMVPEAVGEDR